MNDKIRALQKAATEQHAQVSAILAKTEVSAAESQKAVELLASIKAAKAEIDQEYLVQDLRSEAKSLGEDAIDTEARSFALGARAETKARAAQQYVGSTKAGSCIIDSFGAVLSDVGPGIIGAKAWDEMQSEDYAKGFAVYLRAKGSIEAVKRHTALGYKALQEGLDDQGGVFVPAETLMRIIGREATPTRVAGLVTTITTGRDRVTMPRTQYAADHLYPTAFRATWTGEIPSSDTAADVTDTDLFGTIGIDVYTAMMTGTVTNDMLEDSMFPIQGWFETQFRITDSLLRDNSILNGSGVSQPLGVLTNPSGTGQPDVVLSGSSAAISADAILDLAYQIPEQYDDNCTWVFNKTSTGRAIAKLKDSLGYYVFSNGMHTGIATARPTELVGYPFAYSGFMPDIGASNYPIIFGDWSAYYLVNRVGVSIQLLRETKARRNQVELVARTRFGGKTVEPWKLKIMKSNNS